MSKIVFHDAFIRFADLRFPDEGSPFCRVHFTANWVTSSIKAMGWEDVPNCADSAKLEGQLTARHFVLTPNQKEFTKKELQLECSDVSDFQFFRVTEKESRRAEVRFIARVNQEMAVANIEEYRRIVGSSGARLEVTYAKQTNLPLEEEEKAEAAKA